MKQFKHKATGIVGTLEEDGHVHFLRGDGEIAAKETLWRGFVENSNDWQEVIVFSEGDTIKNAHSGNEYAVGKIKGNDVAIIWNKGKNSSTYSKEIVQGFLDNGTWVKIEKPVVAVGVRFYHKDDKELIYTISEVSGERVVVSWNAVKNVGGIGYKISAVESAFKEGTWIKVEEPTYIDYPIDTVVVDTETIAPLSHFKGWEFIKKSDGWHGYNFINETVLNIDSKNIGKGKRFEVVTKKEQVDYIILSFKSKYTGNIAKLRPSGTYSYPCSGQPLSERELLYCKTVVVNSVKRLSDGEVFTLGDTVDGMSTKNVVISSININPICEAQVMFNRKDEGVDLKDAKKVNYQILEFSVDGWKDSLFLDEKSNTYKANAFGHTDSYTLNEMLHVGRCVDSGGVEIVSVKRLSDGEVFTIGDKCSLGVSPITGFAICGNRLKALTNTAGDWQWLSSISKVKTPLFKTFDGVDIYDGDTYYTLSDDFCVILLHTANKDDVKRDSREKTFSSGDAVDLYILRNAKFLDGSKLERKVLLTTEDGVNIFKGDAVWYVWKLNWDWDVKESTADECWVNNTEFRFFSTEEAAKNYVLKNKPCLSIAEVLDLLEGAKAATTANATQWLFTKTCRASVDYLVDYVKQKLNK